jgi:hypothetical protein
LSATVCINGEDLAGVRGEGNFGEFLAFWHSCERSFYYSFKAGSTACVKGIVGVLIVGGGLVCGLKTGHKKIAPPCGKVNCRRGLDFVPFVLWETHI